MGASNLSEVLALIKAAQQNNIAKAAGFTGPTNAVQGINEYDLEPGARLLVPVTKLLRDMIPRDVGGMGIQANWRSITAVNPGGTNPGVSDGQRGGSIDQTVTNNLAAFAHLSLENFVTFDADLAAKGFDNVRALAVQDLLWSFFEAEERTILGGNPSLSLGTGNTPTGTPSTTGGTLAAGTTYSVIVVPLTYDGMVWSTFPTITGSGAAAVPSGGAVKLPYTRNNADGTTDTINGFAGQKSSASSAITTTGTTGSIAVSCAATVGAMGYAWFVGATAGTEKLNQITGAPSATITALNSTGQLASAGFASDLSTNSLVYAGLLTQILTSGSGAYVQDLGGAVLTSNGSGFGGISQIDTALLAFYNTHRLVPTHIFMNGVDQVNAGHKILNGNTNLAPFFMGGAQGDLGAGAQFTRYRNPVGYGNQVLEVVAHPFLPQGTILFYSARNPYPLSNVAQVLKMKLQRDYYQTEWPVITRKYTYAVSCDGVLQCYFPPAFGCITGVGNG